MPDIRVRLAPLAVSSKTSRKLVICSVEHAWLEIVAAARVAILRALTVVARFVLLSSTLKP